ncbi:hypothetical protein QT06_C0001G0748 [archaeon GW2011_AR15]|nr:hypothetical protein QT06_C0001G0748 [archaeon GW2011_AR15]MBS3103471.1 hypothetical protein [Candidatus Woesearchaeota archaeon]
MGKRSQASIFAIIGLLIVIIIASFFIIKNASVESALEGESEDLANLPATQASLDAFIKACVQSSVIEGEKRYGLHMVYSTPLIKSYLQNSLPVCFNGFRNFRQQGFDVAEGNLFVGVEITRDALVADIDYPVTFTKDSTVINFKEQTYTFPREVTEELNFGSVTRVVSADGSMVLEVPAGTRVTVDGKQVDEVGLKLLDRGFNGLDNSVLAGMLAFSGVPHGAEFSKPVKVTFVYDDRDIPITIAEDSLRLGYFDNEIGVWVGLPTEVDRAKNRITAYTTHFSQLATVSYCDDAEASATIITPTLVMQDCANCQDIWVDHFKYGTPTAVSRPYTTTVQEIETGIGIGAVPQCFDAEPAVIEDIPALIRAGYSEEDFTVEVTLDAEPGQTLPPPEVKPVDPAIADDAEAACKPIGTLNSCSRTGEIIENGVLKGWTYDCLCNPYYYLYETYKPQDYSSITTPEEPFPASWGVPGDDQQLEGTGKYTVEFKKGGNSCVSAESIATVTERAVEIPEGVAKVVAKTDKITATIAPYKCTEGDECYIIPSDKSATPVSEIEIVDTKVTFGIEVVNAEGNAEACLQANAVVDLEGIGVVEAKYYCDNEGALDFIRGSCMECMKNDGAEEDSPYALEWTSSERCFDLGEGVCPYTFEGVLKQEGESCEVCINGKWQESDQCDEFCGENNPLNNLPPTGGVTAVTGNTITDITGNPVIDGRNYELLQGQTCTNNDAFSCSSSAASTYCSNGQMYGYDCSKDGETCDQSSGQCVVDEQGVCPDGFFMKNGETCSGEGAVWCEGWPKNNQHVCVDGLICWRDCPSWGAFERGCSSCDQPTFFECDAAHLSLCENSVECTGAGGYWSNDQQACLATSSSEEEETEGETTLGYSAAAVAYSCLIIDENREEALALCDEKPDTCDAPSDCTYCADQCASTPDVCAPVPPIGGGGGGVPYPPVPIPGTNGSNGGGGGGGGGNIPCYTGGLKNSCDGVSVNLPQTATLDRTVDTRDTQMCDAFGDLSSGTITFTKLAQRDDGSCYVLGTLSQEIDGYNQLYFKLNQIEHLLDMKNTCEDDDDCKEGDICVNKKCVPENEEPVESGSIVGIFNALPSDFELIEGFGAFAVGLNNRTKGQIEAALDEAGDLGLFFKLDDTKFRKNNKIDFTKVDFGNAIADDAILGYWIIDDVCNWDANAANLTKLYDEFRKKNEETPVIMGFGNLTCAKQLVNAADKQFFDIALFNIDNERLPNEENDNFFDNQDGLAADIKDKFSEVKVIPVVKVFKDATHDMPDAEWVTGVGERVLGQDNFDGIIFSPWLALGGETETIKTVRNQLAYSNAFKELLCEAGEKYLDTECEFTPEEPPAEIKVAFIANQGIGANAKTLLNFTRQEGAVMIVHAGNLGMGSTPAQWETMINTSLDPGFAYAGVVGASDAADWANYRVILDTRNSRIVDMDCEGAFGNKGTCRFQDILLVMSGVGTSFEESGHEEFIAEELAASDKPWNICVFHKSNHDLRVGSKLDADTLGRKYYQKCLDEGAIIVTGYDGNYARTRTITSLPDDGPIVTAGEPGQLTLGDGKSFTVVSGLGGNSLGNYSCALHDSDTWWASIFSNNYHMTNGIQQVKSCTTNVVSNFNYGALFITFNVGGDTTKAKGEFKTLNGNVVDSFTITRETS